MHCKKWKAINRFPSRRATSATGRPSTLCNRIAGMRPIERVYVAVAALPVRAGVGRVPRFSHVQVRPVLA